mmetsp:Transcript_25149/g.48964  ORF Transcript_25149/g.48964 Transcript_25149/m.48964 type:complete len:242 (-) Transcript_25149:1245-1970(-)
MLPIAPSIAHPTCSPKPMVTRYPGSLSWILGCSVIFRSSSEACTSRQARTNDLRAESAMVPMGPVMSAPSGRRHAMRKASPMFLLGAPSLSLTARCTMSAIVLTKTMTSSCRHSVQSVKFRTIANPKIALILRPAIIGFRSPSAPRFFPMISDPASPKAIWRSLPNFLSARSTKSVSYSPPSDSSILARGFVDRPCTSFAILERGRMTRRSASFWKRNDETHSSAMMKVTCTMLTTACPCA